MCPCSFEKVREKCLFLLDRMSKVSCWKFYILQDISLGNVAYFGDEQYLFTQSGSSLLGCPFRKTTEEGRARPRGRSLWAWPFAQVLLDELLLGQILQIILCILSHIFCYYAMLLFC